MAIYRRGRTWHYRFMVNGTRYSGPTNLKATEINRGKAEQVESEARMRVETGRPRLQAVAFTAAVERFLAWAGGEYKRESARRPKVSFASAEMFFGTTLLHQIRPGDVEEYKRWRRQAGRVAEVAIRHDLHALSVLFQYGRKSGWLETDPLMGVTIPSDKDARREHILSAQEEKEWFAEADKLSRSALSDIARLILFQGLRPAEAFRLTVEDVDLERGEIYVRESKSRAGRRTLHLIEASRKIVARRIAGAQQDGRRHLFPGSKGQPHIVRLSVTHKRVCKGCGVECDLYDFRHTFATRMAAAGVPVSTLARILGHGDLRTVMRYVHPAQDEQKAAMALYERSARDQDKPATVH